MNAVASPDGDAKAKVGRLGFDPIDAAGKPLGVAQLGIDLRDCLGDE